MTYDLAAAESALAIAAETSAALDVAASNAGDLARAREAVVAMDRMIAAIAAGDDDRRETIICCLAARWDAAEAEILLDAATDRAAKSAAQEARQRRHQEVVLSSLDEAIAAAEAEAVAAEQRADEARGRVEAESKLVADLAAAKEALRHHRALEARDLFASIARGLGVADESVALVPVAIEQHATYQHLSVSYNIGVDAQIAAEQAERAKQVAIRDGNADDDRIGGTDVRVPIGRLSYRDILAAYDGLGIEPPPAPSGLDAGVISEDDAMALAQHLGRAADLADRFAAQWEAMDPARERDAEATAGSEYDDLLACLRRARDDIHVVLDGMDRHLATGGFGGIKALVVDAVQSAADRSIGPPKGSHPDDALDHVPVLPEPMTGERAADLIGRIEAMRATGRRATNRDRTKTVQAVVMDRPMGPATKQRMIAVQHQIAEQEQKP